MDVIVMPSSFLVACFVNDYAPVVDHDLCLYGMHFPLARIVHLLSSPVFRTWYLLFCAVCEGYKAREMPFSLWGCTQPFGYLHIFWGIGAHPSYQRLNLLHIPADVAMVKVKQKAGQRVGYAKTAADQKHQKPVLCV
jgi:hypothetical protein